MKLAKASCSILAKANKSDERLLGNSDVVKKVLKSGDGAA
jgi:hypothetical protein